MLTSAYVPSVDFDEFCDFSDFDEFCGVGEFCDFSDFDEFCDCSDFLVNFVTNARNSSQNGVTGVTLR